MPAFHRKSRSRKMPASSRRPNTLTIAGPVTVRKADGSVEIQPPLTPEELQRLVHDRAVSKAQRARVLKRDGYRCRYCGGTEDLEVDHVVPIALGGSNRTGNLVTACRSCNSRKGARVWNPRPMRDRLQRQRVDQGQA